MIDLKLPEYRIKEFKYQLKEGKTAIIKLFGGTLDDIEIIEEQIEEPDYHPFSEADDYKKPVGMMSKEELSEAVERCKCKKCNRDKQYEIDRTIVDEHVAVEEKKVSDNFNKLSKVNAARCKEIMTALDGVPYKIMEKIGELRTNNSGEGVFVTEPDPYVINDERELPKQKKMSALTEDEKSTLEASKECEWKDSVKNNKINTIPNIVNANLDEKYKGLSTAEKREVSKQIIEQDAKKDATVIKERIDNSIGTNEPLSEELINAPEERSFNEIAWENKDMSKPLGKVPEEIKKVWEEDRAQKSGNTEAYNSLKNSLENQWKLDAEKEKTSEENG